MNPIKTMGIVIRTHAVGDNDMMLTLLSPDMGRISVWAKGIKSRKHPARSSASPLCYSEFILKPHKDVYSLSAAELSESFYGLRNSLEGLALAMYFASLAESVSAEGIEAQESVRLLLNSLYYLEHEKKGMTDLRLMYELRLLRAAGFMPELGGCMTCGEKNALYFDSRESGVFCERCRASGAVKMNEGCAALMAFYTKVPLKSALEYSGDENNASQGIRLLEKFIIANIGVIKARDYLNNIVRM